MTHIARKHAAAFQHDRTAGDETWLTPRSLIDAFNMSRLADVDPCASATRPWPTARRHITQAGDGLARLWNPRHFYFVNPPYGRACPAWLAKAAEHGNGLVLLFARTETQMFHANVWRHPNATAVLFFEGRLRFARADGTEAGSAGAPSALIAYGSRACEALVAALQSGRVRGHIVLLGHAQQRSFAAGESAVQGLASQRDANESGTPQRSGARRRRPSGVAA